METTNVLQRIRNIKGCVKTVIEKIYDQLKTPKSVEEIHLRLNEIGVKWNLSQVKLFLEMDKNITQNNGLWSVGGGDLKTKVINALDELFKDRPKIPIKIILRELGSDITVSKNELLKIVEGSSKYYSPNNVIICRK
ncbi:MAG: hypothetical protein PWR14_614 [Thermosediminibacterales bacterium]|nr:hypothetical protein [Thermosediminibacterales bacterium]